MQSHPQPLDTIHTMKTTDITRALRNATTPASRLAAWQAIPAPARLHRFREDIAKPYRQGETLATIRASRLASTGPELSSLEAEKPLLWLSGDRDPECLDAFPGRDFLDHRGWFSDNFEDETLETYAVRLRRFPRLLFYGVRDSMSGGIRVHLSEWEEIDFSECESEYHTGDTIRDAAKDLVRSYDSTTEDESEDSREYYERDQKERDLDDAKESLAALRQSIRALCRELRALCPGALPAQFPAAASAVRASLARMMDERRETMETAARLRAELA